MSGPFRRSLVFAMKSTIKIDLRMRSQTALPGLTARKLPENLPGYSLYSRFLPTRDTTHSLTVPFRHTLAAG